LDEQLKDDQSPSRQQELLGYKRQIENDNIQPSSFIWQPKISVCDWDENIWTRRLANGLKRVDSYNSTTYTTTESFNALQCNLSKNVTCQKAFFLHGVPDVMLKKSKLISTAAYSIIVSESSDEKFPIEICLQRPPLKSTLLDTPEKFGELMASSYVLLVCKLIQRILNGKIFIKPIVVVKVY